MKKSFEWKPALRISLVYAVFGGAWILFSDRILLGLAPTKEAILFISTAKGWFYVAFTSLLLFFLVRGELARRAKLGRELEARLEEKEVLLHEIHHRVRNNLQMMLSSMNIKEGAGGAVDIDDARMRIAMMSMVHDMAYEHGDARRIDLGILAGNLAASIRQELAPDRPLALELETFEAGIEVASPLGFALLEALVNAFRHGAGPVRLALKKGGGGGATIELRDSGPGFPGGNIPGGTIGFALMRSLAEQARVRVEAFNEGGAVVRFILPDPSERPE